MFTATTNIESRKLRRQSTFVALIDFNQAYNRIPRNYFFKKLKSVGVSCQFLKVLKASYFDIKSCVCLNGLPSDWCTVNCGLKQRCLLSPQLFSLYINDLAEEIKDLDIGVSIGESRVSILLYGDDIILLSETEADLQIMLDCLSLSGV